MATDQPITFGGIHAIRHIASGEMYIGPRKGVNPRKGVTPRERVQEP
jgi:hypothetical protein